MFLDSISLCFETKYLEKLNTERVYANLSFGQVESILTKSMA